jgi:hypothetical protein
MPRKKSEKREYPIPPIPDTRIGPDNPIQSGDVQGLSDTPVATSESVKELAAAGQYFEAAVVEGIENAPDADATEIKTKEAPEDDVPLEYLERADKP